MSAWACGSDSSGSSDQTFPDPPPGGPTTTTSPPGGGVDGIDPNKDDSLAGRWTVRGTDARGNYEGLVDVVPKKDGSGYTFTRTVKWPGSKVEDGRELHWVFVGDIKGTKKDASLSVTLKRADYVSKRGTMVRTAADTPVTITGHFGPDASGNFAGKLGDEQDTWSNKSPLGDPLYSDERKFIPGHAPPTAAEKATFDSLYGDYRKLPPIVPYTSRPEFQAGIHGNIIDTTDFAFYRANPNAIRVAQKVIDDISLLETSRRASAYRMTLADKAAAFQRDMETRWMDPAVGMVVYGDIVANGYIIDDGDASLWTGTYVAAQAFRYQTTGDVAAITPLVTALNGLLTLQEITGDWAHFARSIRKAKGAGGAWHAGTGPYAGFEWLEGGNNDMVKGLFYGYLMGWTVLCQGAFPAYQSYCNRILTNAKHLPDDVKLASNDTSQADLTNKLPENWLYAVLTPNPIEKAQYQAQAEGVWTAAKPIIQNTPVTYYQGAVDWSGQHLTMVGDVIEWLLAQKINLGGDAQNIIRGHIDASHKQLEAQRFATWHFIHGAFGTGGSPSSAFVEDARWRMREFPYPKISIDIDRRISPEFCMSPNPGAPWKQDWMQWPTTDRTEGLAVYPYFETSTDETMWKVGADYTNSSGVEVTGVDYLHLYWFARKYGLLSSMD